MPVKPFENASDTVEKRDSPWRRMSMSTLIQMEDMSIICYELRRDKQ